MTKLEDAELREDTIASFTQQVDSLYNRYGHLFKSYQECEYFYMLPISEKVREATLRRLDGQKA